MIEINKFKNKLLIISGSFPPDSGGPASLLPNLIPELMKNGYEITVLTYGELIDDLPYKVVRISRRANKFLVILKLIYTAIKLAKVNDQIYSFDVYWPGLSAMVASKFLNRKQIARFTGDSAWETASNQGLTTKNVVDFQKDYINFNIQWLKWCRNAILRNCRYVITDSYFLKDLLLNFGVDEKKILPVHNSVEYLPFPENFDKEKFKRENNLKEKIIITISRLVPWKGIGPVMNVLPRLQAELKEISFVCMGDGPEFNKLKKQGEKMATEYGLDIRLLGNLPRKQVTPWFLIADAYVLNTNYEGIAHTLVEALYFKTPVIATRAGGNGEIIFDEFNGLMIDYSNEEQIYKALKRILTDQELIKKFKNNSGEKLKNDFIWERVIEINLKALYV
jgi:glycosyltransferase involved in cell wall biosynthesis